jgi:hypothetical protein
MNSWLAADNELNSGWIFRVSLALSNIISIL